MPSARFLTLSSRVFGESDLIIEVLNGQGERLSLTAKNGRKSRKRFAGGVLEPLQFVEIFYTQSKNGYFYIQEAKIIRGFTPIRQDYHRLQCAYFFVKLIIKATREGLQDNKSLFDLFGNALGTLEKTQSIEILKIHFKIKYLYCQGFLELDKDNQEFVSTPIHQHELISLTDEEVHYLSQYSDRLIRQAEILSREEELNL